MLSLNWQHARKHQSNNSHSKSTFAFGKDSRFKYSKTSLYFLVHLDVTPSIIFPPISEELRLQASEEDQKLNYSTQVCIIHPPKVTMYRQEWIKTKKESYSASVDK
jgi:hypothetical protein